MIRGLDQISYEEKLRKLVLCPEERMLLVLQRRITTNIGSNFLAGSVAIDEVVVLNYKRICKEEFFYGEGGKIVVQVAQRGLRYPIPENIQGQFRQDSELPDLVDYVLAHCRKWSD